MSNIVIVNGINVIEELEKAQKELEELKRDVKRYFKLIQKTNLEINQLYQNEYKKLFEKLSKVGKEE